jgi:superoxide dismutase, Cu-Zn family
MKKLILPSIILATMAGCASMASGPKATANLAAISGSNASGVVHFTELADGSVDVHAVISGVPEGVHGFHIHDKGDCGDNGNAAGGHFNPSRVAHGAPTVDPHHAGDFGNITADSSGKAETRFTTRSITLSTGANSAVGHAVILHASPDDLTTQPTGNAGARIACGVVTLN